MNFVMHSSGSDLTHVVGEEVVIGEQELMDRAIAVVADIVRGDPFLIDCVSDEVRSRVYSMLSGDGVDFSNNPRPEAAVHQTNELPTFLTSAAGRICPDLDLGGHLERVGLVAYHIASAMGVDKDSKDMVRLGGRLHDMGKLDPEMHRIVGTDGVPPPEQKARIKLHPLIGARVVEYFRFPPNITDLVLKHHFRCDGKGYPMQKGETMSPEIGALSVADALDAMIKRRGKTLQASLEEIRDGSGVHFHPDAVRGLSNVAIRRIYG